MLSVEEFARKKLEDTVQKLQGALDEKERLLKLLKKTEEVIGKLSREKADAESSLQALQSKSVPPPPPRKSSAGKATPPPVPRGQRPSVNRSETSRTPPPPARIRRESSSVKARPPNEQQQDRKNSSTSNDKSDPDERDEVPPLRQGGGHHHHHHHHRGRHSRSRASQGDSEAAVLKCKSDLEKMERIRQKVCAEIVQTEKAYVANLNTLVTHYVNPLKEKRNSSVMKAGEAAKLFSNIEQILHLHQVLLENLEKASAEDIHVPFARLHLLLKIYTSYVNGYGKAIDVVRLNEDNSRFQKFLENACKMSGNGLGLMAYLIMPVQRIPRYALLLKQVLKNTTADKVSTIESLHKALANVENCATEINERKRRVDNQMSVLAVQSKLGKSLSSLKGFELYHPSRTFVYEGRSHELKNNSKHVKDRVVVVFSDMVLWATYPGYKYKGHRPMEETVVLRTRIKDPRDTSKMLEAIELKAGASDSDPTYFFYNSLDAAERWLVRFSETNAKSVERSESAPPPPRFSATSMQTLSHPAITSKEMEIAQMDTILSASVSPRESTTSSSARTSIASARSSVSSQYQARELKIKSQGQRGCSVPPPPPRRIDHSPAPPEPSQVAQARHGLVASPSKDRHSRMMSIWGGTNQLGLMAHIVNKNERGSTELKGRFRPRKSNA